ncbi:cysteine proteinase [Gonapodya prolifera JEL478]|uniref:Cysteine proteinase n=1 Tax=Gonapodya prolifera (strain JEL478) TaxID=1344416 RepID=A0A139A108_GONPJ|nr:cysteine proteinase [Gonapodya prolifera JEL478]|eukprot:KXS10432.1 cysteine proteinase [Gonapodya prolifera JEL478]
MTGCPAEFQSKDYLMFDLGQLKGRVLRKSDEESVVVAYGDVVFRKGDQSSVANPAFLTDTVIELWFELLEDSTTRELGRLSQGALSFHFLRPSISFLISHITDPVYLEQALPDISHQTVVFIPVNDNIATESAGGSHWSLLVYYRPLSTFFCFDSYHGLNKAPASNTAKKLASVIHAGTSPKFHVIANAPQQSNGYDCGVYVLGVVEILTERLMRHAKVSSQPDAADMTLEEKENPKSIAFWALSEVDFSAGTASSKRQEILQTVTDLAALSPS